MALLHQKQEDWIAFLRLTDGKPGSVREFRDPEDGSPVFVFAPLNATPEAIADAITDWVIEAFPTPGHVLVQQFWASETTLSDESPPVGS